ncbi:hypothetical protein AAFN85_32010 [Mucilaginibacter sp. CAU 1740]|uniref:hypothetical protein n=1 Tax=Mucilaginibacter sp. CAU 1740 TaxID=3140365 RepID=UPI00325B0CC4
MEKPYQGRTIIEDNVEFITITIPGKRDFLSISWFFVWMIAFSFIGSTAISDLVDPTTHNVRGGMIFWITGWAIMGLMSIKNAIWLIWGREIIEIDKNTFGITKKNYFLSRDKVYDLKECKHFRIRDKDSTADRKYWSIFYYRNDDPGNIAFDYGMKTFSFGEDLQEAESRYILDFIKERGFIPERNFD